MPAFYSINIKTPLKTVFEGKTASLVAPAESGYVGILANHAPFITILVPGKITLRDDSGATLTFKSAGSGLLEVLKNKAVIFLDSVEAGP
ncbi:MAG: F0F1 ATP synthase subunit epsilon [Candidatus Omnitrophica bacterium]|nr:F0F1 ATP synthase subunit epsilon [Candidatus Omnitrophota bacterium]